LFVEQNLNIPAPQLYAMYRDESNGWVYIIMELLPGESLEKIWPTLGESDKALITGKLRSIFTQMRDLPSPSFYGDVCRRDLPNNLFWTKEKLPSISGPFQNEHDLNMGLVEKLTMNAAGLKYALTKRTSTQETSYALFTTTHQPSHTPMFQKRIYSFGRSLPNHWGK